MIYSALTFRLSPSIEEYADVLIALIDKEGFEGIYEDNDKIIAYISKVLLKSIDIGALITPVLDMGCKIEWVEEEIQEKNWNEVWESNFEPVVIDNRCVVRAPFHKEYKDICYQINIEPKMSFGTGHHQTTRMMLEKILDLDVNQKNILDMGCGTGVLSILAAMKGAGNITAIDIDKWAIENTIENAQKNQINKIEVIQGGKDIIADRKFDIILANINRNILLDQMERYSKALINSGLLILSGILAEDIEIISESAKTNGFTLTDKNSMNNWVLLMFKRN
jgi:ribosomal protein L11 methyltransferase